MSNKRNNGTLGHEEEIDQNIELYFFSPNKEKDDFIEQYKKVKVDRYTREKGYRYSPLFIIQKDIRYCLGARKQFNDIPKDKRDPANFAGVILIYTAFYNLVKKFYSGNYPGFAKKFMSIEHDDQKILKYLRHGLIHNNYSLSYYKNDHKYYFILGAGLDELIEKLEAKRSYPSSTYLIDVRKLMRIFEQGIQSFKEYLLDRNHSKARKLFTQNFDVDTWIYIKESKP